MFGSMSLNEAEELNIVRPQKPTEIWKHFLIGIINAFTRSRSVCSERIQSW